MRTSRAVVGFWLMHLFGRPQELREGIAELLGAVAARRARGRDRRASTRSRRRAARTRTSPRGKHTESCSSTRVGDGCESVTAFRELGLSDQILDALDELGYTDPTAIQEQAIPELLAGHDVIGQAQTGTGKTAAFGLPMLQFLDPKLRGDPGARSHPDARALHPGHAGASRLRRAPSGRGDRGVRRPGREDAAVAASGRRARRRRHGRADAGPDLARLARPGVGPLRGARRG